MRPIDVTAVVVSWNVRDLLLRCLASIEEARSERLWIETIVVDNASADGSADAVRRAFPHAIVIANAVNVGFGRANNQAFRRARGRYLLVINPDAELQPGTLAALVAYADAHPEVAVVGPRLLNPDGTVQSSRRRFPTLATAVLESTPLQAWFPHARALRRYYVEDVPDDQIQDVDWLTGACLLVRRAVYEQVGGFDERFFMYSEEIDWCRRIKDAGWRIVYLPTAAVQHHESQSAQQQLALRDIRFNASKCAYFGKYHGPTVEALLRTFLLGTFVYRAGIEAAKLALGHRPTLRRARLAQIATVLRSGLRVDVPANGADRRRRVLFVSGEYPPMEGGVADYTKLLAEHVRAHGVEVAVLTDRRAADRLPASTIETGPADVTVLARVGAWGFGCWREVVAAVQAFQPDIVHVQYQTGAYALSPAINLLPLWLRLRRWHRRRPAIVVTFHDLRPPYLFPKAGKLRPLANRCLAQWADAVVVTNEEDALALRPAVPAGRLWTIPIPPNVPTVELDAAARQAWRARLGIAADACVVGYFGLVNQSKGLTTLLAAIQRLRQRQPVELVVIGGGVGATDPTNAAALATVKTQIARLGLTGAVHWTGWLPPAEAAAALAACDVAALPYRDGASIRRATLLAALANGVPTVTTIPQTPAALVVPGQPDRQILDGQHALLVPPDDIAALAIALERALFDAACRDRLGRQGRAFADAFTWARVTRATLDLYDWLTA